MGPTLTRLPKVSSGDWPTASRRRLRQEVRDRPQVHSLPPGGAERPGGAGYPLLVSTCEAATQRAAHGSHYGGRGLGPASCASWLRAPRSGAAATARVADDTSHLGSLVARRPREFRSQDCASRRSHAYKALLKASLAAQAITPALSPATGHFPAPPSLVFVFIRCGDGWGRKRATGEVQLPNISRTFSTKWC